MNTLSILNLVLFGLNFLMGVIYWIREGYSERNFSAICGWFCAILWVVIANLY
jgi:hypothetical protein